MYRVFGLVVAGGILLGHAGAARAQFVTVGNPWGTSVAVGAPGFTTFNAAPWGVRTYSSGYAGFVAPGTTVFSSGFVAPPTFVAPVNPWYGSPAFVARPGWGYWGRPGWGWRGRGWRRWWW
jgi:hypothetical protein